MNASSKRILVVDDEPYILKSLQRVLEDDYEVIVALGGQAALDMLVQQTIECDVILCDISMPTVNGADFYYQIAEKCPGLEKRIIFMTGGAYTDDLSEFINSVTNVCLEKPFAQEKLYQALEKVLST